MRRPAAARGLPAVIAYEVPRGHAGTDINLATPAHRRAVRRPRRPARRRGARRPGAERRRAPRAALGPDDDERAPQNGRARVIEREEVKTGVRDTDSDAVRQLNSQSDPLHAAASVKRESRLELDGRDITNEIDLASDATAKKATRGPADKEFKKSLEVTANDLEALCKDLLPKPADNEKSTP